MVTVCMVTAHRNLYITASFSQVSGLDALPAGVHIHALLQVERGCMVEARALQDIHHYLAVSPNLAQQCQHCCRLF